INPSKLQQNQSRFQFITDSGIYQALFRPNTLEKLIRMKESEDEIMEAVHEEIVELHHEKKQGMAGGER
ncbi:hypothetical protein P4T12_15020, partial [Aeribacillus composti]|nr:hypothetical protein [Aeribacillus composti]